MRVKAKKKRGEREENEGKDVCEPSMDSGDQKEERK